MAHTLHFKIIVFTRIHHLYPTIMDTSPTPVSSSVNAFPAVQLTIFKAADPRSLRDEREIVDDQPKVCSDQAVSMDQLVICYKALNAHDIG